MKHASAIFTIIFLLSSCSQAGAVVVPTKTTSPGPISTENIIDAPMISDGEEGWKTNALVDSTPLIISNTSESDYVWQDIRFSNAVYDSEIRVSVTVNVELEEGYENSSFGLSFSSHDFVNNKDNFLSLVFQDGYWKLMHFIDDDLVDGIDFTELTDPSQSFIITLYEDQKSVEITNTDGLVFSHKFTNHLFNGGNEFVIALMAGPKGQVSVTSMNIEKRVTKLIIEEIDGIWEQSISMEGTPTTNLNIDDIGSLWAEMIKTSDGSMWAEIPQTLTSLETDIRIKTSMDYPDQTNDNKCGSQLVLNSVGDLDGENKTLYIGFQDGYWKAHYVVNSEWIFHDFPHVRESAQSMELTILDHGRIMSIKNEKGNFDEILTFDPPLFTNSDGFSAHIQYCSNEIEISQFSIERKIDFPSSILAAPNDQNIFYVDPSGSDSNNGTKEAPFASIGHARDVIRTINKNMTRNIEVIIANGTYQLSEPVIFTPEDSGSNGYQIIYRSAENSQPILSGGVEIKNWEIVPGTNYWKSEIPENIKPFRQLYINGNRAQRASLVNPITGTGYAEYEDSGNQDGIRVVDNTGILSRISKPEDLELHWVYDWKDMRLPVQGIELLSGNQAVIYMKQPFFKQAQWMGTWGDNSHPWYPRYDVPFFIENAYELMDQPGEWYFNKGTKELFYIPRADEIMEYASIIIPQTEQLVRLDGLGIGNEVHDIRFDGITFAYGSWTRANDVGVVNGQAQSLLSSREGGEEMTLSHIQIESAKDIVIENNRFLHMGAAAVLLGNNTSEITINGNLFYDISDAAIVIGNPRDVYILFPALQKQPQNITVKNNLIDTIGVEYRGASAINAYYVENVQIANNELSFLPYTGISLGWGWGDFPDSVTCSNNQVINNLIEDITQIARDAGGIYTLGQQPGTIINNNVIRRQLNDYGCIYLDEGSAFIKGEQNVCDQAPNWLMLNTEFAVSIHDNYLNGNYTNVRNIITSDENNRYMNNVITNTTIITNENWPTEAKEIIENAGLQEPFLYLHDWLDDVKK